MICLVPYHMGGIRQTDMEGLLVRLVINLPDKGSHRGTEPRFFLALCVRFEFL